MGWMAGQSLAVPSGRKWQGSQSCQGTTELGFPGPTLGQMQSEAARRAGEPSGQGEEPSSEGLGGYDLLAQTDARCPASHVMCHHLDGQPGAVGWEATRREMVESHAVLEVSDGVLDLGVAAMVGLQCQGVPVPVGDAAVIAVAGEEGQLETGRGLHLPDSVVAVIAFGRRQFHCASGERFRSATGRSYLIRAMANAGRCPNPCAGGTQRRLASPEGISCLEAGNEPRSGSGSASCGCCLATVYVGSSDELVRRGCCGGGSLRNSSSSAMRA